MVVLGDSIVLAVQVPLRQTFCKRLEDRLNERADGYRYRVIDAGVQGYGPVEDVLFYEAVGDHPEGKVLVLASNGYTDVSMGGGTKLSRLQEHGCAGILTDGRLRDFDKLAQYNLTRENALGESLRWFVVIS